MSKGMVELPGGGQATENEALSALVLEAKRRGTSYGMLTAGTTGLERVEIIRDYCMEKRKKRKEKAAEDAESRPVRKNYGLTFRR